MRAVNRKFLYNVNKSSDWLYSHCHKPTPLVIDDKTIRVYFGARSISGITRTTFVDLDATDLYDLKVKYIHDKPVFEVGKLGAFDDSGANVSSLIEYKDKIYMYYIGWNPSTTVHTRNSIGVVVSRDKGVTFDRIYDGSILDRTKDEPYYTGAVDVNKEGSIWKIWYTSGSEWIIINGKPEIKYHIKYAESENGIDWKRNNIDCILPSFDMEVTARPSVFIKNGQYNMLYSKRGIDGFRVKSNNGYRAGYATSSDGITWLREDCRLNFDVSLGGWDSDEISYPYVIKLKNKYLCFYNGNGFGKSGFGYAILES